MTQKWTGSCRGHPYLRLLRKVIQRESIKKTDQAPFLLVVTRQEVMGTNWNTGDSLWVAESIFSLWREQALAWVSQRDGGVSSLGDIQKPSRHDPGHPAPDDL